MTVSPKWIVAATGESLTEEVAEQCRGHDVIAVNDAYRRMPYARALYAADAAWWTLHNGCPGFAGEKWITVNDHCMGINRPVAEKYGLSMIWSVRREEGFSFRPGRIHIGANSGFQAVNLALLWGGQTVVLVGFDMKGSHFFGDHPPMARRSSNGKGFMRWIRNFERAAEMLPAGIRIINATPGSALTCFPAMPLEEALRAYTGSLDRKVALERNIPEQDLAGEMEENWQRIGASHWARRAPVSGDERFTAQQFVAREQVQFTVRWTKALADIGPGDRLVYPVVEDPTDPQIYDILAVHERGWREALIIVTARRAEAVTV